MGRVNAERVIGESGIQTNEQCATIWPLPLVSRGLVVLCVCVCVSQGCVFVFCTGSHINGENKYI